MTFVFVTSNKNKFREAKKLAERYEIDLEHQNTAYTEIQADTLEEVVESSAKEVCERLGAPCFVEDAGLFIDSLKGFPGPYSSYVFKTVGNEGVIKLMKGTSSDKAEFKSVIGYCEPGSEPQTFTGKTEGKIIRELRGTEGFGYDPIFVPNGGDGRTFAEMPTQIKNNLSHRAKSIEKLVKWYTRKNKADGD